MLTILHTNDLHGALGMLPRLATLIARERAHDPAALLLDAGDLALDGPAAPLGVQLLAALRYDGLTPGNAENDVLAYRTHFARIGAPVVVANMAPHALGCPTTPMLLRRINDINISVLGLTTPPVYPAGHPLHRGNADEIPVDDAVAAAQHWVPRLRRQADLVVVLSHLGLRQDIELARAVGGIDLIVGGHSHHRLPTLLRIGATHIAHAGVGGAYLGVITVERSGTQWAWTGRLEPVWQPLIPDAVAADTIHTFLATQLPAQLTVVGHLEGCWADPWRENAWCNFVTDTLCAHADVDICFYNANVLRPALDPGVVRRWDLLRAVPGVVLNERMGLGGLVAMRLPGTAIQAICEHSVTDLATDFDASAPPTFALPGNPLLHVAGLRLAYDLSAPPGRRVTRIEVGRKPLDLAATYTVATSSFLARGYSGFRWFRDGMERREVGGERGVLMRALGNRVGLADVDGRLGL